MRENYRRVSPAFLAIVSRRFGTVVAPADQSVQSLHAHQGRANVSNRRSTIANGKIQLLELEGRRRPTTAAPERRSHGTGETSGVFCI